jgi:hypothetical protein
LTLNDDGGVNDLWLNLANASLAAWTNPITLAGNVGNTAIDLTGTSGNDVADFTATSLLFNSVAIVQYTNLKIVHIDGGSGTGQLDELIVDAPISGGTWEFEAGKYATPLGLRYRGAPISISKTKMRIAA